MSRALLVTCAILLAWIVGHLSAVPDDPPPVVVTPPAVHVHVPPAPDPLPSPPPQSWPDRRRDRFALNDAPGVLTAWRGITAASGTPALAAWNDEAVMWSGDDGHTWARHTLPAGQSVSFAAAEDGWIHLLLAGDHGAWWSFSTAGTRTVRRAPLDPATTEAVAAGPAHVAILGLRPARGPTAGEVAKEPALLVSGDHGGTWKDVPAPWLGNAGNELRVEAGSAIIHMGGQEAPCGGGYQQRARLTPGAAEWTSLAWPLDTPLRFWLGAAGWAYASGACRDDAPPLAAGRIRLCAIGSGEGDEVLSGPELDESARVEIASNGRVTYAIVGRDLFLVKGAAFRRVALDVPASLEVGAGVDAGGRLVGIAAGRLVRWSAAGWEVLLPG